MKGRSDGGKDGAGQDDAPPAGASQGIGVQWRHVKVCENEGPPSSVPQILGFPYRRDPKKVSLISGNPLFASSN